MEFNSNDTVLVVTRNSEQFSILSFLFQNAGYGISFADSVREGIFLTATERPGLVISELAMTEIDGLELCRRIRENNNIRSTPIIVVGDLPSSSPIVMDSRRCGASYYMQKPFDPVRLFNRCTDLLNTKYRDTIVQFNPYSMDPLLEITAVPA